MISMQVEGPAFSVRDDKGDEHECSIMAVTAAQEIEAYATGGDPPGLAVLDTACGCTMNGEIWAEKYRAALQLRGLAPTEEACKHNFRGIGGRTTSTTRCIWPVCISGIHG